MPENRRYTSLIPQTLSAIAVVLSLVFVGLEVRESARQTALNTQSLQAAAYQELLGRIMDMQITNILEPDALRIRFPGERPSDLSPDERRQLRSLFAYRLRYGDLAFYQYELGMLSPERFESAMGPVIDNMCDELFGEAWAALKPNFVASYREYMESRLAQC